MFAAGLLVGLVFGLAWGHGRPGASLPAGAPPA
jgi:hypothetical protein